MKTILNYLFEHKYLTKDDAKEVLKKIAQGVYNDCEIASFLTVYIMRRISVDELTGFRDALLDLCIKVDLSEYDPIDLCGTGGDGKNTFNISTLSSFIVAGTGQKVAKHGNYGVSSGCGSSNVLEYLGIKFTNDQSCLRRDIETAGICFLHAPLFNPAMKNVAPVRKQLRIKTFFNMLGPMVNPSFPKKQIVGVFSLELARLYNYLFQKTDKQYIILHSLDGYDEISLTGDVKVISNNSEQILKPTDLGFKKLTPEQLDGGQTVEEAAKTFMNILEGNGTDAQNSVVLANSALALKCSFPKKSIEECIEIAKKSLMNKKALNSLKTLIENSKK